MGIDFAHLKKDYTEHQEEINEAIQKVLNSAQYILGEDVFRLEEELADFVGVKHAVTTGNGTESLILSLIALGVKEGDEIITTPYTFIASSEAIAHLGAKPIFVDIHPKTFLIDHKKIEAVITPKTKGILVVSLFGQIPKMESIWAVAKKYQLFVLEDGAQSFGATYETSYSDAIKEAKSIHPNQKKYSGNLSFGATYETSYSDAIKEAKSIHPNQKKYSGNLSIMGTTSFFPAKPLGCYGDGGAIFTNDDALADKVRALRVHGKVNGKYKYMGLNSRLDTMQAAILRVKLRYFKENLRKRRQVALWYDEALKTVKGIQTPYITPECQSSYAQYSLLIEKKEIREQIFAQFKKVKIPFAVYYDTPLHLQENFAYLKHKKGDFPVSEQVSQQMLSLPINPYLQKEDVLFICENIISMNSMSFVGGEI